MINIFYLIHGSFCLLDSWFYPKLCKRQHLVEPLRTTLQETVPTWCMFFEPFLFQIQSTYQVPSLFQILSTHQVISGNPKALEQLSYTKYSPRDLPTRNLAFTWKLHKGHLSNFESPVSIDQPTTFFQTRVFLVKTVPIPHSIPQHFPNQPQPPKKSLPTINIYYILVK